MTDVVNNKAHHRYELAVDGHLAATYYKMSGDVITFVHTEVPPELGGKGIAVRITEEARKSLELGAIAGQRLRLLVVDHLQPVFDPAQELICSR